jgi:acetyl-CoA C-acetyltransferase
MNAVLDVDQSASLLLTSVDRARALGIDEARWVFLHGYADANDSWYVSERRDYTSSPALSLIAKRALDMAGAGVDDIDCFDLYSCFPSSVQISRDAIGIAEDDPRPLTVTGGLAAHGGAGNNYAMHSIATMADRLRAHRGRLGLVTAMGWYVTKHSIGIYGSEPPARPWRSVGPADDQAVLDRIEAPPLCLDPTGRGRIETYTVPFDKDAGAQPAVVVGRLESGGRFLARTPADASLLAELVESEGVGRTGMVRAGGDGRNRFRPD